MNRRLPVLSLALAAALAAGAACRRPTAADRGAKALGRAERNPAVYVPSPEPGGRPELRFDLGTIERPRAPKSFTRLAHLPPVEQGATATCWAFGTVSLLESELRRLGKADAKLSEMFVVYWEYVEKARRFVREKGDSALGQGGEPDSALARVKQYGIVRESDFPAVRGGEARPDHRDLYREWKGFLEGLRGRGDWDEARALAGVRAILDRRLGRPPDAIEVDGRTVSPREYAATVLGLPLDDYLAFVSLESLPAYGRGELPVPDNWRRSADYVNLPLTDFELTLLRALRKGFTATMSLDFTEPGHLGDEHAALVPTFDVPGPFLDADARELRFVQGATTDDHVVHAVGYLDRGPHAWFLGKDSWETAWRTEPKGYMFYRDDYVRLKVLMFVVHEDAVGGEILRKIGAR